MALKIVDCRLWKSFDIVDCDALLNHVPPVRIRLWGSAGEAVKIIDALRTFFLISLYFSGGNWSGNCGPPANFRFRIWIVVDYAYASCQNETVQRR